MRLPGPFFHSLLVLATFTLPVRVEAGTTVPEGFPIARYEPLWKKSPFTLSSVSEESVVGFAQSLALSGVAQSGSSLLITVVNKQNQQRFLLSDKQPANGISLVSLQSSPDLTKVTATIKKGDETAVIRYDPALLAATDSKNPPPQINQPPLPSSSNPQPGSNRPRVVPRRIIIPSSPPPS